MEPPPQTPPKIVKTCLMLQKKLQVIEAEVIQFTNLPANTACLDLLAEDIRKRFVFFRNLLTAEIASYGSTPPDLSEIEGKLVELEAEFSAIVHDNDGSEDGSVCDSCLNNDREVQKRETGSEGSSEYEVPEMLNEVMVPSSEVFHEATTMPPSSPEEEDKEASFDCEQEESSGGKKRGRRWCKVMAVVMTVSGVLTVSLSTYFDSNQHDGFLTPT